MEIPESIFLLEKKVSPCVVQISYLFIEIFSKAALSSDEDSLELLLATTLATMGVDFKEITEEQAETIGLRLLTVQQNEAKAIEELDKSGESNEPKGVIASSKKGFGQDYA